MEKQRTRARASWKGAEKAQVNPVYQALPRTEFVGRETLEAPAIVTAALDGEIALDRTPFYAEAGGQVGDTGVLVSPETGETVAMVEIDVRGRAREERASREAGCAAEGRRPGDRARRSRIRAIRPCGIIPARICCTRALRTVLGTHVKQAGSVVEPSRLRFRFHALYRDGCG